MPYVVNCVGTVNCGMQKCVATFPCQHHKMKCVEALPMTQCRRNLYAIGHLTAQSHNFAALLADKWDNFTACKGFCLLASRNPCLLVASRFCKSCRKYLLPSISGMVDRSDMRFSLFDRSGCGPNKYKATSVLTSVPPTSVQLSYIMTIHF